MQKIKRGLMTLLILTLGIFLTTGCSGTKELTGNIPTSPNNLNSTITSFDFLKNNGNQAGYNTSYFDNAGTVIYSSITYRTVVTTDYPTSNVNLNHSIQVRSSMDNQSGDSYGFQMSDGFYVYNSASNSMTMSFPFPLDHGIPGLLYLGQESLDTPLGTLVTTKVKGSRTDGSYIVLWMHSKYFTVKEQYFTSQNIKIAELNISTANN